MDGIRIASYRDFTFCVPDGSVLSVEAFPADGAPRGFNRPQL